MRITQFSGFTALFFSFILSFNVANVAAQSAANTEAASLENSNNQAANNQTAQNIEMPANSNAENIATNAENANDAPLPTASNQATAQEAAPKLAHDLSVLGMYQGADIVVKIVMIGLVLASIATWTIALAKGLELFLSKRKLHFELGNLKKSHTLQEASQSTDHKGVLSHLLVFEAITELNLSANNLVREGVKERVAFRLSRLIGNLGRSMSRGTGILATIGATAPFVGLFGTVWGIMNSFIGIAKSQTTNLAVVAPGIAEALLATALGLVAAIPAVIIYNVFARSITSYKAHINDCASEVLLLLSRDLDRDIKVVMQEVAAEVSHQH